MYRLDQIKLDINHTDNDLRNKIVNLSGVRESDIDWTSFKIIRKSIDARDKNNIMYIYNVIFDFVEDKTKYNRKNVSLYSKVEFNPLIHAKINMDSSKLEKFHPIIVGFGPAGIFAAYIFVLNGIKPIIIERGESIDDRKKSCEVFLNTLKLNPESNVCFGEGGAGAFSDGKLNTNNKDRDGIYKFILETFVKYGADNKITYENLPHIGTDKLSDVIKNIRNFILEKGAIVKFNTKFTFDLYKNFATNGTPIILAIGNSSRDTFRDLFDNGFNLKPKTFAVGYRVAHKQIMIDEAQYGTSLLGPATYKLTFDAGNNHSVYSFCMCPGGYIINSSNVCGELCINGMSYNDRSGLYANSAIVETITPDDLVFWKNHFVHATNTTNGDLNPLVGIEFQEMVERRAFSLCGGYIPYDIIYGDNVEEKNIFKGLARKEKNLMSIYENIGLPFDINKDIKKALIHFNNTIKGFNDVNDAPSKLDRANLNFVIAGIETRTSSPVNLDRDENMMCNMPNFYPCGEGLGHGGGIVSCASDGIKVAISVLKKTYI